MKKRALSALLVLALCLGLAAPAFAAEEDFVIENGVLVSYSGPGGNVTVPDGVTEIGFEAFYGFFSLSGLKVTLPSSVRVIGERAFCESPLSSIDLPEGLTTIEYQAFAECIELTSVTLPASLKTIGDEAFDNCTQLSQVNLPSGLSSIGRNAFSFCKLKQVNVPAGVSLGQNAFYGNPVTSATIGGRAASEEEVRLYFYDTPLYYGAGDQETGDQDTGDTTGDGTGSQQPTQTPDPVQTPAPTQKPDNSPFVIENGVLLRCTATSGTVTVPEGVTHIGDGESRVFDRGVLKVVLPDTVCIISAYAFEDSTVQEVNLPQGVRDIGHGAFRDCDYLKKIAIPAGVTEIGDQAFQGCSSLTSVILPQALTKLGDYAFSGCTSLTNVTLPASLTKMGSSAFYGCPLTSITLPKGLKKLGDGALAFTGLSSLTLPEGLEELGSGVVSGCEKLTSVTFPKTGKVAEGLKTMTTSDVMNRLGQCPALREMENLPAGGEASERSEAFRALFEGVDPSRWVSQPSQAIQSKSDAITAGISGDYEKAKAIYDWVTQNIAYDYDYFGGSTSSTWFKADDVLEHKTATCSGYANLTRALLWAQGIPALYIHGTAGGQGHAWNAAYVDGRWIWIDSTWGRPGSGDFLDPRYFDPNDFFLARTHVVAPPPSNNFKSDEAKADVAAEEKPDPADIPSSWAQEQVDTAIRSGLVPGDLQSAYRANITREEFCRLMVVLVEERTGMTAAAYAQSKDKTVTDPFTDTHHPDVLAAYALGIVKGTSDTAFNPTGSITRQEAASMLSRTAKVLDIPAGQGQSFGDDGDIASWAKEGVAFTSGLTDPATGDRVMGGTGDGKFSPLASYTREQVYLTALRLSRCGQ